MFKDLSYKNVDSEEVTDLIKIINEETSEFNSFLLFQLDVINISIERLSESKSKIIELPAIKELVYVLYLSKKVLAIFSERNEEIKVTSSDVTSIKINAEAIINGVGTIAELQKKNMLEVPSGVLFIYLTT